MKNLWFATHNAHKIAEVERMLAPMGWAVRGIAEAGLTDEIEESGLTLTENAQIKARYAYRHLGEPCISDDSGLEVDALGGQPGVHSARYAGEPRDNERNLRLLLSRLRGCDNRTAHFRTVICMILADSEHYFEGRVDGSITTEPRGSGGFGYDPVFRPYGHELTFAEMSPELKNSLSHRARAVASWLAFIKNAGGGE